MAFDLRWANGLQSSLRGPQFVKPAVNNASAGLGGAGFPSYSSVFEETKNSLLLLEGQGSQGNETQVGACRDQRRVAFRNLPRPLQETCLLVLQCLPGQSNEQVVFRESPTKTRGWDFLAVKEITFSLQEMLGDLANREGPTLEAVAEIICSNTAQPIQDDLSSSQQWLDQFCGPNLRWESLGLLWALLARTSDALGAHQEAHLDWIEGKQSLDTARACLNYCIKATRHFTEGNYLLVELCRRRATLDSIVDGDARMSTWGSFGVTIAIMTFLGLHTQEESAPYKPSLCSENKRRTFAQVFSSDKMRAAFTGRPPLMSRRYCSTPLPLDIRDEDLASDEASLARGVQSLDDRGWNTEGGLYLATLIRARCMIAFVRDELIEVALGKGVTVTLDHLR
ncbi:hypothetical protein QQX98_010717 [Neonectria punicea]|uniref:Xylanolytic transcriptional activator regulatory domain-containing protein n=1 Tax=Neonectria punicea TaxID=979145 RepID=A0ABR1GP78_9HYPO